MVLTSTRSNFIVVWMSVFWIQTAYSNAVQVHSNSGNAPEDEVLLVNRLRIDHRHRTISSNSDIERNLPEDQAFYDFWKMVPKEESMSMTNAPTNATTVQPTDAPIDSPPRRPTGAPTTSPS